MHPLFVLLILVAISATIAFIGYKINDYFYEKRMKDVVETQDHYSEFDYK